ncbi:MAG TPA: J domain-containing protein [Planctomycetota bacterium]
MSSPWDVLGVEPGCSPEDLRKAYAKQLKLHRPDVDPEGFRRIRDAYEFLRDRVAHVRPHARRVPRAPRTLVDLHRVLDVLQRPPAGDGTAPEPQPPQRARERGKPRRAPLEHRIDLALAKARSRGRAAHELRILQLLAEAWRKGDERAPSLEQLLLYQLSRQDPILRTLLRPEDALRAIERGNAALPVRVLEAHVAARDFDAVQILMMALETTAERASGPVLAHVLVAGARVLALPDVYRAERLANLAFRELAGTSRERFEDLELWIQAGKQARAITDAERLQIGWVLLVDGVRSDGPEVAAVLPIFDKLEGTKPTLANLFAQRFPDHAERVSRMSARTARKFGRKGTTAKKRPSTKPPRNWPPFWVVFWFVWIVVSLLPRLLKSVQDN